MSFIAFQPEWKESRVVPVTSAQQSSLTEATGDDLLEDCRRSRRRRSAFMQEAAGVAPSRSQNSQNVIVVLRQGNVQIARTFSLSQACACRPRRKKPAGSASGASAVRIGGGR